MTDRMLPFRRTIDRCHDAAKSIVLRYRNAIRWQTDEREDARFKELLERTSIAEGLRIFYLLRYQGVDIYILDETSLMHTHTLKSIDGCVTAAYCLFGGNEQAVFESGGNTGTALTAYLSRVGVETFCFVPEESLPLLSEKIFEGSGVHLLAVREASCVKEAARLFERHYHVERIPKVTWRYQASMLRGCYVLEYLLENSGFDYLVQTVSAGFGPIGIYRSLAEHGGDIERVPSFLGVQQAANCPAYRAWVRGSAIVAPLAEPLPPLLTRVMYDREPQSYGTFEELEGILKSTQGGLVTINHEEFQDFLSLTLGGKGVLGLLKDNEVDIEVREEDVREKTGLIALAGLLKQVSAEKIPKGSRVLCCLTSGSGRADGRAVPEYTVTDLSRVPTLYGGGFREEAARG